MSDDLVAMAYAASHDERLSDGMLYRKLADEITALRQQLADHQARRCGNCADFRDAACESETAEASIVDFIADEMCCPHWRGKDGAK